MSIEDEIAAVKAAAEKKLRRLRERERKRQQDVDMRMLTLLRSQHVDLASRLEAAAREQLAAETAQRSSNARASRAPRLGETSGSDVATRFDRQPTEFTP